MRIKLNQACAGIVNRYTKMDLMASTCRRIFQVAADKKHDRPAACHEGTISATRWIDDPPSTTCRFVPVYIRISVAWVTSFSWNDHHPRARKPRVYLSLFAWIADFPRTGRRCRTRLRACVMASLLSIRRG